MTLTSTRATTSPPTEVGYVRLCDACLAEGDGQFLCGEVAWDSPCSRCPSMQAIHVLFPEANEPREAGPRGLPLVFSTAMGMEPWPPIHWDTNGYYRDLGVGPRATRKEIREAYQQLQGWRSPRLTYIVIQLLDPVTRRRYDGLRWGQWLKDYDVETMLRREHVRRTVDDLMAGRATFDDFWPATSMLDSDEGSEENQRNIEPTTTERRDWGYYTWASPHRSTFEMDQWRGMLCAALAGEPPLRIAVGFHRVDLSPLLVRQVGRHTVAFLHDCRLPSSGLAAACASRIVRSRTITHEGK